jgi:hypothetical protein
MLILFSLPLDLVKVLPSQEKVLHRLVYRSLPVIGQSSNDTVATHSIRLEVPLVDQKQVRSSVGIPDGSVLEGAMFWSGSSINLDVLIPDRCGSSTVGLRSLFDVCISVTWTFASMCRT